MSTISEWRCKSCNAVLNVSSAVDGVAECKFCHNVYTVPKESTSEAVLNFLRMGEHDLDTAKFDDAYAAFAKAAQLDLEEPQAYFGMALAEFKVQQLTDYVNQKLQPICHAVSDKAFSYNKNYRKALSLATECQRKVYEAQCKDIDAIKREFYALEEDDINYDTFICVKVSDGGEFTRDSHYAASIYDHLKDRGYKPFYSEREIKGRTGAAYEALILYALMKSECMIVVCSDESYLQTPWVKNEYTRFLKLIGDAEKDSDAITVAFLGSPIERLTGKRSKIQGIDLGKPDAFSLIESYVEKHTPQARAIREKEQITKELEAEEIRKQIEEQKRAQAELEKKLHELSSPKGNIISEPVVSVYNLLVRAKQFSRTDVNKSIQYYNRVLDMEPENESAWLGLFLIDCHADDVADLSDSSYSQYLLNSKYYDKILQYGSKEVKESIIDARVKAEERFNKEDEKRKQRKRKLVLEQEIAKENDFLNELLLNEIEYSKNTSNIKDEICSAHKKSFMGAILHMIGFMVLLIGVILIEVKYIMSSNSIIMTVLFSIVIAIGVIMLLVGIGFIDAYDLYDSIRGVRSIKNGNKDDLSTAAGRGVFFCILSCGIYGVVKALTVLLNASRRKAKILSQLQNRENERVQNLEAARKKIVEKKKLINQYKSELETLKTFNN